MRFAPVLLALVRWSPLAWAELPPSACATGFICCWVQFRRGIGGRSIRHTAGSLRVQPRRIIYADHTALGFLAFFGLERYTAMHRAREHLTRSAHMSRSWARCPRPVSPSTVFWTASQSVSAFRMSAAIGLLIAFGIIAHDSATGSTR